MVILEEFSENLIFMLIFIAEKKSADDKSMKNYRVCKEIKVCIF